MAFRVVAPTLDLWPKVKEFYLYTFCESGFYDRLQGLDLPTLEGYYVVAVAGGMFGVAILVREELGGDEEVVGFSVLTEDTTWKNLDRIRYAHIRGVFLAANLPRAAGRCMNAGVEAWVRKRGLTYVQGYVRPGFKHDAAQHLYGFQYEYGVIARNIDPTEGELLDG